MENETNGKIIMIVNGQPIEMCPKTLEMCNKRSQRMITALKSQSLEKVHTMRLFWGDVIMLNIITNQLLQKVDSRSLARVLKPTNSLEEDLNEYREARKSKVDKLKDALIVANDSTLPLDYSRELEKYFYDDVSDNEEDTEELSIDKITVPELKNNETPKESEQKQQKTTMQKRDKKVTAPPSNKSFTMRNKNIYRADESEEEIDFSSNISQPQPKTESRLEDQKTSNKKNEQKNSPNFSKDVKPIVNETPANEKTTDFADIVQHVEEETDISELFSSKKPEEKKEEFNQEEKPVEMPQKNEFEKHQESFTSFGAIDLDSLFG